MSLIIRPIKLEDSEVIEKAFKSQGWNKPREQYVRYVEEQAKGLRPVLLAEWNGEFAGYLTIQWEANYPPFRESNIPEIVDLNVLTKFHRRGIATALMDKAEEIIKERHEYVGIGFGVTSDYGPAQALYVRRGYIPDARGIWKDGQQVKPGDTIFIDDGVIISLLKRL